VDWRSGSGGILWLLELAESYPNEIHADFRSRYHISFEDVGGEVSWREAIYLTNMLLMDPESWLQKSKNGWKHPASYEWMLLAELVDITIRANSKKKTKPIQRPWPDENQSKIGGSTKLSKADVLNRLKKMNPKE